MVDEQKPVSDPTLVRELDREEVKMVSGGWIEVVTGPDGAPGCAVVHPGPGPSHRVAAQ